MRGNRPVTVPTFPTGALTRRSGHRNRISRPRATGALWQPTPTSLISWRFREMPRGTRQVVCMFYLCSCVRPKLCYQHGRGGVQELIRTTCTAQENKTILASIVVSLLHLASSSSALLSSRRLLSRQRALRGPVDRRPSADFHGDRGFPHGSAELS